MSGAARSQSCLAALRPWPFGDGLRTARQDWLLPIHSPPPTQAPCTRLPMGASLRLA